MKIGVQENKDNINIAGDFSDSIEASMDNSSLPFVLEMLSKNFYSNPIGSICREITSNCFDSHIEAGVTDPVTIKRGCDEEGWYISFIDVGVGLSPERMKSIYVNYFSSTKRDDNLQIGGFGLGSKSPLSYVDYFYINTVVDNVKYQYIFSKGENIPSLDLVNKSDVEVRNGTEVRIYIKDGDLYRFEDELKNQLCYFDNVYFEEWEIDNNYNIFEGTNFKYRNKNCPHSKMCIVLDKVIYPIDWKQLGMDEYNIAVGVKFEIGELLVTPNREQLRYTDEIIQLIKNKIKCVIDELISIFDKQNKSFDSFFEWFSKKDSKPFISFTNKDNEVSKLYLYGIDYINKRHTYKYFEGIEKIAGHGDILSLFYTHIANLSGGKKTKRGYYGSITYSINSSPSSIYISNTRYIDNKKNWRANYGNILYSSLDKIHDIRRSFFIANTDDKSFNLTKDNYFNLGAGIKLYNLIKAIRKEVSSRCREYRELTPDELEEYNDYIRENNTSLQRRLSGKVFIKHIGGISEDWTLSDIDKYKGIVIYGFREDAIKLSKALTIITCVRKKYFITTNLDSNYTKLKPKVIKIISISKTNEKHFNKENMINVNNLYGDNKLFRDIASSYKIENFFNDIRDESGQSTEQYIKSIELINGTIGAALKELYIYYKNITKNDYDLSYTRTNIKDEIVEVAEKFNLYNQYSESLFDKINDWFKGIEVIRYTPINNKTLPFILKFLYEKKKKLNIEYYQKVLNTDNTKQLSIVFEEDIVPNFTKFRVLTP